MHLVEKLWILSEKFCFKFIRDKGCPDPDPTPDPAKSFGSDRIRIRLRIWIHNTSEKPVLFMPKQLYFYQCYTFKSKHYRPTVLPFGLSDRRLCRDLSLSLSFLVSVLKRLQKMYLQNIKKSFPWAASYRYCKLLLLVVIKYGMCTQIYIITHSICTQP